MNTLMIHSLTQGIRYTEATAVAPSFNLERLTSVAALLVRAMKSFTTRIGGSLGAARA